MTDSGKDSYILNLVSNVFEAYMASHACHMQIICHIPCINLHVINRFITRCSASHYKTEAVKLCWMRQHQILSIHLLWHNMQNLFDFLQKLCVLEIFANKADKISLSFYPSMNTFNFPLAIIDHTCTCNNTSHGFKCNFITFFLELCNMPLK